MTRVTNLCVGESLKGEGNEVAHIDLMIGPRGSAVETAFATALTNNKDGFSSLLAVVAPNLMVKPNTVMFNKVTIKNGSQAVQMFGPAQRGVSLAIADSVKDGTINESEADDLFITVGVFIHWQAQDDMLIQQYNYEATKEAVYNAVNGLPSSRDVQRDYEESEHPFGADKPPKVTAIDVINKGLKNNKSYKNGLCNSKG
ncbi:MAG TPA: formaldehyde-activating enzyme [Candidatus Thioglobus sp.]|jgi:5,6,7,8-tetrahydromethanopterin hydro-lyase|nr:formaldehyde-activating enzyme [Candidatus Thioglobus sp.]